MGNNASSQQTLQRRNSDSFDLLACSREAALAAWPQGLPENVAAALKEKGLKHSNPAVRNHCRELLDEFGYHNPDSGFGASGSWVQALPLPAKRSGLAAAAVDGLIYIAGGSETWYYTKSAASYDPVKKAWEELPPMPTGRHSLALAALGGCLYALGGFGTGGSQNTAERFDTKAGRSAGFWEVLPGMLTDRRSFGAAGLRGLVYAVGGHSASAGGVTAQVECFHPVKGTWQPVVPMPTARSGLAVAVCGGQLYAFGGGPGDGSALGTVERFTPSTMVWESLPSLPTPRTGLAAAVTGGKVYVLGGSGEGKVLTATRRFDPVDNAWEDMPTLPEARWQLAAAAVDGQIYALGGEDGDAEEVDGVWSFEP